MAGSKRLKIDVAVLDVLMKSARFTLHEHIPTLGSSVGADHRALEDAPNMPQVNQRRILIGQGHDGGLKGFAVGIHQRGRVLLARQRARLPRLNGADGREIGRDIEVHHAVVQLRHRRGILPAQPAHQAEPLRDAGFAEHDRRDGCFTDAGVEAERREPRLEETRVLPEPLDDLRAGRRLLAQPDRRADSSRPRRRC